MSGGMSRMVLNMEQIYNKMFDSFEMIKREE